MKVLILGDVHGCWDDMNITIARAARKHPDITHIIQVGDLAYGWPGTKPFKATKAYMTDDELEVYNNASKYWLDGNHENFDRLDVDGGAWLPDWTYMPRGSVLEVDGQRMMFFGGATSSDKEHRTAHTSWWPQEAITYSQVQNALDNMGPLDAVFSHDHPASIPYSEERYDNNIIGQGDKQGLQAIMDYYKPDFWFFGHHHIEQWGTVDNTNWYCCPIIESRKYTIWDGFTVINE